MTGFMEVAYALAVLTQSAQPAERADRPWAVTLGEDKPPQIVHERVEEGEFPQPGLRYRVSYTRNAERHSFVLTANGRQVEIEVPISEFPGLNVSEMNIHPGSYYADPVLVVVMEYGESVDCFANVSPHESLTLAFYEVPEVRRTSYANCSPEDITISDNSGIRIGRITAVSIAD